MSTRIIEFEGRRIEVPVDFSDDDISAVLAAPPLQAPAAAPQAAPTPAVPPPSGAPPFVGAFQTGDPLQEARDYASAAEPAPAAMTGSGVADVPHPLRPLRIGAQESARGLVEGLLLPADIVQGGLNLARRGIDATLGTNLGTARAPSDVITSLAAPIMIPREEMSSTEQLGANISRMGGQAAVASTILAPLAAARQAAIAAGQNAPRLADSLLRPYMSSAVGRTVAGDAAAAAGAGAATTGYERMVAPENQGPVGAMVSNLLGGVAGAGALQLGEAAVRGVGNLARRAITGNVDPTIPIDPTTNQPVTRPVADQVARLMQSEIDQSVPPSAPNRGVQVSDRIAAAADRIEQNRDALTAGGAPRAALPTPAALSEDTALMGMERQARQNSPTPFIDVDRARATAQRDMVDQNAPPSGSDPAAVRVAAQQAADAATLPREIDVQAAQRGVAQADEAGERIAAPVTTAPTREAASEALDRAFVRDTYLPDRTTKNTRFDEALRPIADRQVPADDLIRAAADVRARVNQLIPQGQQIPGEFVQAVEALAPEAGQATVRLGDVAGVRGRLADAAERARQAGNLDLADAIGRMRQAVNQTLDSVPELAGAQSYYRDDFAPRYRQPAGDAVSDFTRTLDRSRNNVAVDGTRTPDRSATPPSQTAREFIRMRQPERLASLMRAVEGRGAQPEVIDSARQYLMADMATSVLDRATGAIRPDQLRAWRQRWGSVLDEVPQIRAEVDTLLVQAGRGERMTEMAGTNLRTAQESLGATRREIERNALGLAIRADPEEVLPSLLSRPDRRQEFQRLVDATRGNDDARNGLRAMVQDYLTERVTNNQPARTAAGDTRDPVSFAKLSDLLREYDGMLSQIYSPAEMNRLQAVRRSMGLSQLESVAARTGSQTSENLVSRALNSSIGNAIYAAAVGQVGALRAGSYRAVVQRSLSSLPNSQGDVERLVFRALFDPDLATQLLRRPTRQPVPNSNRVLGRAIAVGEGARQTEGDE